MCKRMLVPVHHNRWGNGGSVVGYGGRPGGSVQHVHEGVGYRVHVGKVCCAMRHRGCQCFVALQHLCVSCVLRFSRGAWSFVALGVGGIERPRQGQPLVRLGLYRYGSGGYHGRTALLVSERCSCIVLGASSGHLNRGVRLRAWLVGWGQCLTLLTRGAWCSGSCSQ